MGWLFEPGNPEALAGALLRAVEEGDLAGKGALARKRVVERWSNERLADRHLEIYSDLLHRGGLNFMAKKEKEPRDPGKKSEGEGKGTGVGGRGDLTFPKWLPAVLYGAVTLLLFRKFVFSGQMLVGQDTLSLGYVARAFFAQALRQGTFPFWNPIILGGTPFIDSLAGGDSLYPTSLLLLVMEPFRALGWKLVLHVFAAGLFTYGWILSLGRSRAAALLCGLAYLLAPFMVTLVYPGHDGKLFVTALTPLLFWATERALAGGRLRAFGGMSLVIGLVILTTHFQQAYFLFGSVGVYALVRLVLLWKAGLPPRRSAARFGMFLAFSVVGAGVAAVQLVPAVQIRHGVLPPDRDHHSGLRGGERRLFLVLVPPPGRGGFPGGTGVRREQRRGGRVGHRHVLGQERLQAQP